jgi:hypothetical protein
MRIVWTWIVPLIVVAGIVVGISYFQGDIFHHKPQGVPQQQDVWVVVPHPPGDRVKPEVPVVKEFGAWHFACLNRPGQPPPPPPKVGYIQNLGLTEDQTGKQEPCHVFISMRNSAAPWQTMILNFIYRRGMDEPEFDVLYTIFGKKHVLYDTNGQIHDLTKKEKWKGGYYMKPGENMQVQHEIPEVAVQLGGTSLIVPTGGCVSGHCFARLLSAQTGEIGPKARITVRLPGPPHGQPREVNVPSDGLMPALAELERRRPS